MSRTSPPAATGEVIRKPSRSLPAGVAELPLRARRATNRHLSDVGEKDVPVFAGPRLPTTINARDGRERSGFLIGAHFVAQTIRRTNQRGKVTRVSGNPASEFRRSGRGSGRASQRPASRATWGSSASSLGESFSIAINRMRSSSSSSSSRDPLVRFGERRLARPLPWGARPCAAGTAPARPEPHRLHQPGQRASRGRVVPSRGVSGCGAWEAIGERRAPISACPGFSP